MAQMIKSRRPFFPTIIRVTVDCKTIVLAEGGCARVPQHDPNPILKEDLLQSLCIGISQNWVCIFGGSRGPHRKS